ncbi:MAG: alanine racemase [Phaeodactylibacter sp.]|uniref:alanine racemase n=1 Tax=Phaeodactylibacter sp. TaxID=1940289 RepID=UPI0032F01906
MGRAQLEIIGGTLGNGFVRMAPGSPDHPLKPLLRYSDARPSYGGQRILVVDHKVLSGDWEDQVRQHNVDQVVIWGFEADQAREWPFTVLSNPMEARRYFSRQPFFNTLFLVCASEEEIYTELLGYMGAPMHQATLRVDLDALRHNLDVHRASLKAGTAVAVMVKANAYGTGLIETGRALERAGVAYLTVAYADEGVQLRQAGIQCPIMVLNTEEAAFEYFVRWELEPVVYHFPLLKKLARYLERHAVTRSVHLEFNTGMNRLGFEPAEAEDLGAYLSGQPNVRVATVFAHLAASGAPEHDAFTRQQMQQFTSACTQLEESLGYSLRRHLLNSGGVARFPQYDMDMVRLGIGVYGADETGVLQPRLQTVMTLEARVSQVRTLGEGATVGYSRAGKLPAGAAIATLGIGYADGVPRALSNGRHRVLINGQLAPIAGNVCMDMCMVNVSEIPEVEAGAVATIFGAEPSAEEVATVLGTIPYEVFTSVGPRVRRVYCETLRKGLNR